MAVSETRYKLHGGVDKKTGEKKPYRGVFSPGFHMTRKTKPKLKKSVRVRMKEYRKGLKKRGLKDRTRSTSSRRR